MAPAWGPHFEWTDARCDKLRQRWTEGWSASTIGNELGISRCAVIGKARRLGLEARKEPTFKKTHSRGPKEPSKPKATKQRTRLTNHGNRFDFVTVCAPDPIEPIVDSDIPIEQRKTLLELENCHCRWPVGEPNTPEFFYCGAPVCDVVHGVPYCPEHTTRSLREGNESAAARRARLAYQRPGGWFGRAA